MSNETEIECTPLVEIDNLAVANGAPYFLLRTRNGGYLLGQKIGDTMETRSRAVMSDDAVDWAVRVLGGDKQAVTHPRILTALALALVGMVASGQIEAIEREKRMQPQ